MTIENDFVPFATGGGANVLSQAAYLASPNLSGGQQPGVASSALNNKAIRQATYIAACLAQYLVNVTGNTMLDDGNMSEVIATMAAAWASNGPTITALTSGSGTYTVPAGCSYLRIRLCGGGGGGGGGSDGSTNVSGSAGVASTFGTSLLTANGGAGGVYDAILSAAGGTATIASPAITVDVSQGGSASNANTNAPSTAAGTAGGTNHRGGAGAAGYSANPGANGIVNTGAGGGGGGGTTGNGGTGGGAGGYLEAIIPNASLSATYAYTVGAGGAGGSGAHAGGNGGSGVIIVEAF